MQKHPSPTSAKQVQPVNDDPYDIPPFTVGRHADKPPKLSREEVSKCINIWAEMYRLRDDDDDVLDSDASELCMPSRPWLGRSPNSVKRFE